MYLFIYKPPRDGPYHRNMYQSNETTKVIKPLTLSSSYVLLKFNLLRCVDDSRISISVKTKKELYC
jgi:hypothetical protein